MSYGERFGWAVRPLRRLDLAAVSHSSDSQVQLQAEKYILSKVAERLGVTLSPGNVMFGRQAIMSVDGRDDDHQFVVEVYARQGKLKPGQQKKIVADAFRLVTLVHELAHERDAPPRAILAFADEDAAAYARGSGWFPSALEVWNVEVLVIDLPDGLRQQIIDAQELQSDPSGGSSDD